MIEVKEEVVGYIADCPYCDSVLRFEKEDEFGISELPDELDVEKEDKENTRFIFCPVCKNVIQTRNILGSRYSNVYPITRSLL